MTTSASEPPRRILGPDDLADLRFDPQGLLPVVVQEDTTGRVLMVAWANREALDLTLQTGQMHFWSRSRGELWRKGATSGNTMEVVSLHPDCDGDTLLARVRAAGPACHTGTWSCFGVEGGILPALWAVLEDRARHRPQGSYTARLLADENLRWKKLGEETVELATALATGDRNRATEEAADLLYHLLVALLAAGITLEDLMEALRRRMG